VPGFLRRAT